MSIEWRVAACCTLENRRDRQYAHYPWGQHAVAEKCHGSDSSKTAIADTIIILMEVELTRKTLLLPIPKIRKWLILMGPKNVKWQQYVRLLDCQTKRRNIENCGPANLPHSDIYDVLKPAANSFALCGNNGFRGNRLKGWEEYLSAAALLCGGRLEDSQAW